MSFGIIKEFEYDGHLILCHQVSNQLYTLNETGKLIWKYFKNGLDQENIAKKLTSEFFIPYDRALKDVEKCFSAWKHADFFDTSNQADDYPCQRVSEAAIVSGSLQSELTRWHSRHYFSITGRTIKVSFGDPELEAMLLPILDHLKGKEKNPAHKSYKIWHAGGSYFVVIKNKKTHSTKSLYEAIGWILYDLADQTYRNRDCMSVLHGGAVRYGEYAVILPGGKGSGKSTLIAALQHDGFEYLSDDICPLEKNGGKLLPVPLSQRLKSGSWGVLESLYPSLKKLPIYNAPDSQIKFLPPATGGQACWDRSWPVAGLIFPQYEPGLPSSVHRLKPLELLSLLANSESLGSGCERSLLTWLETVPAVVIRYSDLAEARKQFLGITKGLLPGYKQSKNILADAL